MQHDPWIKTYGREPQNREQPYMVKFRNGRIGGPYVAKQLQWGHHRPGMCDDFDVVEVRRA